MGKSIAVPPVHLGEHGAPITDVAVRQDARTLATASYDGTVLIWDIVGSGKAVPRASLRHRRLVNGVSWNPRHLDLVASASADKTVAIWDIGSPDQPLSVLGRHTDDINSVAWLPDGRRAVCVSEDGVASLWDALSGRFLGVVASHAAHCMDVSINDAGLIATVGEDGLATISEVIDEASVTGRASRRYDESIEACCWSASGNRLALASDAGCVHVVDSDLRDVHSFDISDSAVRSVAWRDADRELVAGSYDGRVYLLDSATGRVRNVHDNPQSWPRSLSCAGDVIAVGSFSSVPELLSPSLGNRNGRGDHRTFGPNALASDGRSLFVGCDSGTVFQLPVVRPGELDCAGVVVHEISGGPVLSLAATADRLFAGSYSGHVVRLSATGDLDRVSLGAPVPSLTLLAEGRLAAGTYGGEIVELDQDLRIDSRRSGHQGSVKSLDTAGEGRWLLSGATDRTVAAAAGGRQHVLWEHGNLVNSVTYRHGYLASASRDHTVKVAELEVAAGDCTPAGPPLTLLGPDESVKCVALLKDGEAVTVVAGSYDFSLWAWQIPVGAKARQADPLRAGVELMQFDQGVSCMCLLDDTTLVAASWDGTLQIVQLRSGRPVPGRRYALRDLLQPSGRRP